MSHPWSNLSADEFRKRTHRMRGAVLIGSVAVVGILAAQTWINWADTPRSDASPVDGQTAWQAFSAALSEPLPTAGRVLEQVVTQVKQELVVQQATQAVAGRVAEQIQGEEGEGTEDAQEPAEAPVTSDTQVDWNYETTP